MNISSTITDAGVWIAEREGVRTLRVHRHLAVAFLAGLGLVFGAPFFDTLLGLALISILVFVVLDALAKAMDAHRGFLWGWLYPEPKQSTQLDRFVNRIIHRVVIAEVDKAPAGVRTLDPLER